jgi:hypothetical protein
MLILAIPGWLYVLGLLPEKLTPVDPDQKTQTEQTTGE